MEAIRNFAWANNSSQGFDLFRIGFALPLDKIIFDYSVQLSWSFEVEPQLQARYFAAYMVLNKIDIKDWLWFISPSYFNTKEY